MSIDISPVAVNSTWKSHVIYWCFREGTFENFFRHDILRARMFDINGALSAVYPIGNTMQYQTA